MKKAKKIASILFSLYIMLAMGGFSLFHHYCGCNTEPIEVTSVLVEKSCCSSTPSDDFGIENHMVCHSDSGSEKMTCGDDGCNDCNCNTQVEVLKLDYTILSKQSAFDYSILYQIFNSELKVVDHSVESQTEGLKKIINLDKSPPKAGKYLVILHHNLKIPFSIS